VHRVHRRTLFRVQREDIVTKDSGELFQVGIELVQVCTEGTLSGSERREVSRRDTHRVTEYSIKFSKEGLRKRSSGGHHISLGGHRRASPLEARVNKAQDG
jgi:hypothetical protein